MALLYAGGVSTASGCFMPLFLLPLNPSNVLLIACLLVLHIRSVRELIRVLQGSLCYSSICLFADQSKPHIVAMYEVGACTAWCQPKTWMLGRAVVQTRSGIALDAEQALDSPSLHQHEIALPTLQDAPCCHGVARLATWYSSTLVLPPTQLVN